MCLATFYLQQVSSTPLIPSTLCNNKLSEKTHNMAREAFLKVTSPLALTSSYGNHAYRVAASRCNCCHHGCWNSSDHVTLEWLDRQEQRFNGFTEDELSSHCLHFFANQTAKLTIEFVDKNVMQIKLDTRLTLMDQMGIIGHFVINDNFSSSRVLTFVFRWHNRGVYRILNH